MGITVNNPSTDVSVGSLVASIGNPDPASYLPCNGDAVDSALWDFGTPSVLWSSGTTRLESPVRRMAYGNGVYLVSNLSDVLQRSTNLQDWQTIQFSDAITSLEFLDGRFVFTTITLTGHDVYQSTDGLVFTKTASVAFVGGLAPTRIVSGGGKWLSVLIPSDNPVYWWSDDMGMTWTAGTLLQTSWDYIAGVVYGNGIWVCTQEIDPEYSTSLDGINWIMHSTGNIPQNKLTFGAGLFCSVSMDSPSVVLLSADGLTWTVATTDVIAANQIRDIVGNEYTIVALFGSGAQKRIIRYVGGGVFEGAIPPAEDGLVLGKPFYVLREGSLGVFYYSAFGTLFVPDVPGYGNLQTYIRAKI